MAVTDVKENQLSERILEEYGINADYVRELLGQYRTDPNLVPTDWREYFATLTAGPVHPDAKPLNSPLPAGSLQNEASTREGGRRPGEGGAAHAPSPPAQVPAVPATTLDAQGRQPIRGAALRTAQNMIASLEVPTATSQRIVSIKLLEENRRLLNDYRAGNDQAKISFTHLIAWAVVRALVDFPRLNDAFTETSGQPERLSRDHIALGIAVDVARRDGSRTLLVPNVKDAGSIGFARFLAASDDAIGRARAGKSTLDDFAGTTVSLTNPGPMGTTASVARLMPGQGLIVATGAIDYPAGFSALAPAAISRLGVSKVMTLSCTYDHRIIQGAESGSFLGRIDALLHGEDGFYESVFADLQIPYRPLKWAVDNNPAILGSESSGTREMEKQARVLELINAYRVRGHLIADIDPLRATQIRNVPELDLETYGLTIWDLDREFITGGLGGSEMLPLRTILEILRRSYCGKVGVEYRFIQDAAEKEWLRRRIGAVPEPPAAEVRKRILWKLLSAESFERFLHNRFLGQKRFSIEGNETLIPLLDQLVEGAGRRGVEEITIGMSHRGRLNVIANVIGHFCERIFASFEGIVHPDFPTDEGDVKYHRGARGERAVEGGRTVSIEVVPNPSHLEFVDPVVEGIVRARQDAAGHGPEVWIRMLPVLIHGDAAFAGQGIVAETFNLSQLKGYRTGGTIHVVVNNQIGFTTLPDQSRSSLYSTDMAKINQVPIFHVNADDPEAAHRVLQTALDYRQEFHKDIVLDLVGFRRHGHNEGDEPSYTQPLMYDRVREHPGVFSIYARKLVREGVLTEPEIEELKAERLRRYEAALARAKEVATKEGPGAASDPARIADPASSPETGVPGDALERIGTALTRVPAGFTLNPKVVGLLGRRAKITAGQQPADWAVAESLAFGSLLVDGVSIRFSGEDTTRGTFSQRHMILHDTKTGQTWTPLATLAESAPAGARFAVYDSALSEAGVLGFEYGYSVASPRTVTLWEAQYGDFVNVAQVIVDQFVASGEEKWGQKSRLVLLLPHGQEGQGPEHSSARPERFLELAVGDNLAVCQPTTAAQYFHLLRRQGHQEQARPLVVLTPKSMLRLASSFSPLEALTVGKFATVLPDEGTDGAKRLVLCSGKLYYDLAAARSKTSSPAAIARLEQLAPFPEAEVSSLGSRVETVVWAQEEPENMGAWNYLRPRLAKLFRGTEIEVAARPASSSPATGTFSVFQREQEEIIRKALGGP